MEQWGTASGSTRDGLPEAVVAHALSVASGSSVITDAERTILFVNDGFTAITGYTLDDALGLDCRFLQGVDSDRVEIERMRSTLALGARYDGRLLNYRKNGEEFWNELTISPIRDAGGVLTHYASVQRDVSERVELETRAARLLQETIDQGETAHLLLGVARSLGQDSTEEPALQRIVDVVPRLAGADAAAILRFDASTSRLVALAAIGWEGGLPDRELDDGDGAYDEVLVATMLAGPGSVLVTPEQGEVVAQGLELYGLKGFASTPLFLGDARRGVLVAQWRTTEPPARLDAQLVDRLTGLAALAQSALDNIRLVSRLTWDAEHDALTGLANRVLLERSLTAVLEESSKSGHPVAVISCDIDRLRRANDSLGHRAGDEIVRFVAQQLTTAVGDRGLVARTGGDEFVVVVPRLTCGEEADQLVERITRLLDVPVDIAGTSVFVRVAIGFATRQAGDDDLTAGREAEQLISRAVSAMSRSKGMPRSLSSVASASAAAELRLDADLRGAVVRGEIVAWYQPQVDLATGAVVGVEALARWNHPELGILPPALFIPIAEENGLIDEIGRAILDGSCRFASALHDRGFPLDVAVNVSALQLASDDFLAEVEGCLRSSGLTPDALTIEITESHLVEDPVTARQRLQRLRDLGVEVSIDDFGTGYSSLTQLLILPVSELKIDRSFVQSDDPTGKALVTAVVGLSRGLGHRVVAEGIETVAQLEGMKNLGVDRGQGHVLGMPMEAHLLVDHVVRSSASSAE